MCGGCKEENEVKDNKPIEISEDQSDKLHIDDDKITGKFGVRENPCAQYPQARNIDPCANVPEFKEKQWSRLGPLGVLLDPKIIPITVESERLQQPHLYMELVREKDPKLFALLQEIPSKELVDRVNKDRLVTTYMHDYGHEEIMPSDEYKRKIEAARAAGEVECPQTYSFPVDRCPPNERSIRFVAKTISDEPTFHLRHEKKHHVKKNVKSLEQEANYVPPISEYGAEISELGAIIMRDNLHGHGQEPQPKLNP